MGNSTILLAFILNSKYSELTPKEVLNNAGIKDQISGFQSIELSYELSGEPVKFFLPRIKYSLHN
jgi:hypothetical protein